MDKRRVLLFDFDGTLVDSMPTYGAVMLRILDELAIPYGEDIIKTITPLGYIGTAKYYISLGAELTVDELTEKMREYMIDAYSTRIEAKDFVKDTLAALKDLGYELCVLTASPHATLDPCLKRCGLWDLFRFVWSCDDFGTTKSDPDIYRKCAERLGVGCGDIVFLDDNYNALATAVSAGTLTVGVFDRSSEEYTDEIKKIADGYIKDFSELEALLRSL